jgi:hypothetical protein
MHQVVDDAPAACRDGADHCPCFRCEHVPRRPGDGRCCDCGAVNPDYPPSKSEAPRE